MHIQRNIIEGFLPLELRVAYFQIIISKHSLNKYITLTFMLTLAKLILNKEVFSWHFD